MRAGEKIKYYREQKNMSQAELAKAAGYTSRSSISKIEKEETAYQPAKYIQYYTRNFIFHGGK